ncbi:MAG: ABC transporter substrate-binding protein [Burkholderiaceae bacterium]
MSRNEDRPLPTTGEIREHVTRADRRRLLKSGAGAGAIVGAGGLGVAQPAAAQWTNVPERGARLRVLRWKRFVQGDEDMWATNTKKFSEKYEVEVRIDAEGWEDVRPKAAVAANVGSGPDIIISTFEDAHQYPDKLVDVSDVCNYLGKKYGGWYPVAEAYGMHAERGRKGNWVAVPMGAAGNCLVYRDSHVKAAGFDSIPKDLPGFLKLCQAMKAKGTPPGFALGNATGDANTWCHWLLWAHGGKVVDDKNNVVLNSPETVAALEYAKQLYATFVPGTLSWLDPNNNKAFLDGQCSMVFNGISVYYAAKTSTDPKLKEMVSDIRHANMPVGVTGKPTELNLFFPMMVFRYTKFPRAAKEYLRFMMEQEQYLPWQEASIGYVTQPLRAYESNPIWTVDPKHTPYRDAMKVMLPNGHDGEMGYASAAVMADFVVVNMIAEAASGQRSPKEAAERAHQRAQRYYKV